MNAMTAEEKVAYSELAADSEPQQSLGTLRVPGAATKHQSQALHLQLRRATSHDSYRSLDGPIRANRSADSRELPDSRESFHGSRTEPFLRIALRGT